ncbi:uncharacterized protein LOC108654044 [Drosophila navojoa]|uniref:uncharacterized protein LOC108654044 n=1 Tax=Drosophila navojoa TaxID=7232 RepID=UPI0008476F47|nr:uncharacterized protein LOC108654044 [Drosophila navojoa]
MRPVQSMLAKVSRFRNLTGLGQPAATLLRGKTALWSLRQQQRRQLQKVEQYRRKATTLQSMREFFMHPLTWDRNNGYLNVVLALAIFTFVFINSCTPCPEDRVPQRSKKTEE